MSELDQNIQKRVAPHLREVSEQSFVHTIAGTHMYAFRQPDAAGMSDHAPARSAVNMSALHASRRFETVPADHGVRLNDDSGANVCIRQNNHARSNLSVIRNVYVR